MAVPKARDLHRSLSKEAETLAAKALITKKVAMDLRRLLKDGLASVVIPMEKIASQVNQSQCKLSQRSASEVMVLPRSIQPEVV